MSEWLKIVKKYAKLNPGKSLKEYLPDAQAEYKKLKQSGKVVLKTAIEKTKKAIGGKKKGKHSNRNTAKKQRGGSKDSDGDDNELDNENVDRVVDVDEQDVDTSDMMDEVVAEEDEQMEEGGNDDIVGGGNNAMDVYHATISMKGRTRAGGKRNRGSRKSCKRGGKKGGRKSGGTKKKRSKKSKQLDVAVSQMLATAPMMMKSRARSGGKMKRSSRK